MQPVFRHDFFRADFLAHAVGENLSAASRQAVQPCRLQAFQGVQDGDAFLSCEMLDFRCREGMDGNVEAALDAPEHFLIKGKPQIRVQPSLDHDLSAACLYGFLHFSEYGIVVQKIGILVLLPAEKGAEAAFVLADIGVVDIAVHDEGHGVSETFPPDGVCHLAEFHGVPMGQHFCCFFFPDTHHAVPPVLIAR